MAPVSAFRTARAADAVLAGGVVAYPTEAVWGLGCDPLAPAAVARLLRLKRRRPEAGLILIASREEDAAALVGKWPPGTEEAVRETWPGPATWLLPAAAQVPGWITGGRDSVALRVTAHPVARALCEALRRRRGVGWLVSTSANRAGGRPARDAAAVRWIFGGRLDALLPGALGDLPRPTPIRDARSGATVRA